MCLGVLSYQVCSVCSLLPAATANPGPLYAGFNFLPTLQSEIGLWGDGQAEMEFMLYFGVVPGNPGGAHT